MNRPSKQQLDACRAALVDALGSAALKTDADALSDYGRDGAPITYKAWVCSNPACGFNIRIDNGEISLGRSIGTSSK